eukprot:TRINITY_DN44_c0_g1_i4.p1 TRINITY_DN44_c0_g1~~TRINITY_DN44_c0_g1_i4.p1  ORF type:complete len:3443 (+),score=328.59 TRINITY_DN44_c0_g1_i4:520-10848(+)
MRAPRLSCAEPSAFQMRQSRSSNLWALWVALCLVLLVHSAYASSAVTLAPLSQTATPNPSSSFSVTVNFDNSGTSSGYGPYIDLILPAGGPTFTSATILGATPVTSSVALGGGCVDHPYLKEADGSTPTQVCGAAGETLLTIRLPFLSFAEDQPNSPVQITFDSGPSSAVANAVRVRGGFYLGNTYEEDQPGDVPVYDCCSSTDSTTWSQTLVTATNQLPPPPTVQPDIVDVTVNTPGTIRPAATGVYTGTINVGLPDATLYTNINVTIELGDELGYLGNLAGLPGGASIVSEPPIGTAPGTPLPTTPNNTIVINVPSFTGTAAVNDFTLTFDYGVPEYDATGALSIPKTGNPQGASFLRATVDVFNTTVVNANLTTYASDSATRTSGITLRGHSGMTKGRVLQVNVGGAPTTCTCCPSNTCPAGDKLTPGDTIRYTLSFPGESEYFSYGNIIVEDTLSDGLLYDLGYAPTLTVTGTPSFSGTFTFGSDAVLDLSDKGYDVAPATSGNSVLTFNVSQLLETDVNFPLGRSTGGFNMVITYQAIAQDNYTDSTQSNLVQGDTVRNDMTVNMESYNVTDGSYFGTMNQLADSTTFRYDSGNLVSQTIYARNGIVCSPQPCADSTFPPRTNVTFRTVYEVPSSDFDALSYTFFLPDPLMPVSVLSFFNGTNASSDPPPLGVGKFGPSDTFFGLFGAVPNMTTKSSSNRVDFIYPKNVASGNEYARIDLLFTVTVADVTGFADGTPLNIVGYSTEGAGSNQAGQQLSSTTLNVILDQPVLTVFHGALTSSSPGFTLTPAPSLPFTGGSGGCPTTGSNFDEPDKTQFASTISDVDAGDVVTFAFAIANNGGSDAFDMVVRASIPEHFQEPVTGPNICVYNGLRASRSFVNASLGQGLFDQGIEIIDVSPVIGAIRDRDSTNEDILVITYDLQALQSMTASTSVAGNVSISSFAAGESGPNQASPALHSASTVIMPRGPQFNKNEVNVTSVEETLSSQGVAGNRDLAVGETVLYQLNCTFPEGRTAGVVVQDTLPAGLQYVSSVISSTGGNVVHEGVNASVVGQVVTWSLGQVNNTFDNLEDTNDAIVIDVTAIVDESSGAAVNLAVLTNAATLAYTNGGSPLASSVSVDVVESCLTAALSSNATSGDAGDPIRYTATFTHCATSRAPAYNVSIFDVNIANLTLASGSVAITGAPGNVAKGNAPSDEGFLVVVPVSLPGESISVSFDAILKQSVTPGSFLSEVSATWESLPPSVPEPRRMYTVSSTTSVTVVNPILEYFEILSTSNPETGTLELTALDDVTIGEVITFNASIRVMEGTTKAMTLTIILETGAGILSYYGGRISALGSRVSGPGLSIGQSPVATDAIGADGFLDRIEFSFGPVTNLYDNVNDVEDLIIFEVSVVAADVPANTPGDVLQSVATMAFDPVLTAPSLSKSVELVGPVLTLTKVANVTSGIDAGDPVLFTLTLPHTGGSTSAAFDVNITDVLTDRFVLQNGTVTSSPVGSIVRGNSNGDRDVLIQIPTYLRSQSPVVITFQARANNTVIYNDLNNPNTGTVVWDSSAGVLGRADTSSDSVTVTAELIPTFTHTHISSDLVETGTSFSSGSRQDLAIGEEMTREVVLTLREGISRIDRVEFRHNSNSNRRIEILETNITWIGANLVTSLSVGDAGLVQDGAFSDSILDRVRWTFGEVQNNYDNVVDDNDRIKFSIRSRVHNRAGQAQGTNTVVRAFLDYSVGTLTRDVNVDNVDHGLTIAKVSNVSSGDAGDVVGYQVTVGHDGSFDGPAYLVNITDVVPAGLVLVPGTVSVVSAATSSVVTGNGGGDASVHVNVPTFQQGQTIVVTYSAVVNVSALPAEALVNSAVATSSSHPNIDVARVKTASDGATVTRASPSVSLAIVGDSISATAFNHLGGGRMDVSVGEHVTFHANVTLPEGRNPFSVTVQLPTGAQVLEVVSSRVFYIGSQVSSPLLSEGNAGTASNSDGDGLNDRVVFSFGDMINSPDGVSNEKDVVVVEVVAEVSDVAANAQADVMTTQAHLDFDTPSGTTRVSASEAVDLVEPQLAITKSANITSGDAGDANQFTIVVSNTAGCPTTCAPAFDLVISDVLNTSLWLLQTGSVQVAGVSPSTVTQGNGGGDTDVVVTIPTLLEGATAVVTFDTVLAPQIAAGATLPNRAILQYDSHPDARGRNGTSFADSSIVSATGFAEEVVVIATSDANTGTAEHRTGITDLVVGEQVIFNFTGLLPEATSPVRMVLNFPFSAGQGKLGVVSSRVVHIGSQITGSALSVGQPGTAADVAGSGDGILDQVTFDFGTVTNNPDTGVGPGDRITVEVTATVPVDPANVDNIPINAVGTMIIGSGVTSANATIDVVQPVLQVSLASNLTVGDAGDVALFTVSASHTGASTGPAYNLDIVDKLPNTFVLASGSVMTTSGIISKGNLPFDLQVNVLIPTLIQGASVVVNYAVYLNNTVVSELTADNQVDLSYSSSPGSGRNTSISSAVVQISIPVFSYTFDIVSTSIAESGVTGGLAPTVTDLFVGELVTYRLVLRPVEGTTLITTITINLPTTPGILGVVSSNVTKIPPWYGASLLPGSSGVHTDTGSDGVDDQIVFNFGTIVNHFDNKCCDRDEIIAEVTAIALDLPPNIAGATVAVSSTVRGTTSIINNSSAAEIVTGDISSAKTGNLTSGDAGDAVGYVITLQHGASSEYAVYNVTVSDLLDDRLALVCGSVSIVPPIGTVELGNGGSDVDVVVFIPTMSIANNSTVIRYDAIVKNTVVAGSSVPNVATMNYTSSPFVGSARILNDSSTHTIGIDIPEYTLSIVGTSLPETGMSSGTSASIVDLAIGETVTFRGNITLPEGSHNVTARVLFPSSPGKLRVLDSSVKFIGGSVTPAALALGSPGTVTNAVGADSFDDSVTFAFGVTVNTADNVLNADDMIIIEVVGLVEEDPSNARSDVIVVSSFMEYDLGSLSPTVSVELVEPALNVVKTANISQGDAGDIVGYQVVVSHTGVSNSAAFDVNVTDTLPSLAGLVPGTVFTSLGNVVTGNGGSDAEVYVHVPTFTVAASPLVIRYEAILSNAVEPDFPVTNVVDVSWRSANRSTPVLSSGVNGRLGSDQGSATLNVTGIVVFFLNFTTSDLNDTQIAEYDPTHIDLAVGEYATFRAKMVLPEGTNRANLTLSLSSNDLLAIVNSSVVFVGAQFVSPPFNVSDAGVLVDSNADTVPDQVLFDFGEIVNTPDNSLDDDDSIVLQVTVRINDHPAAASGAKADVSATLRHTQGSSVAREYIDIVEPFLEVNKSAISLGDTASTGDALDKVLYTLTVAHTSGSRATAYHVSVLDLMSKEFMFNSTSVVLSHGTATFPNSKSLSVSLPSFSRSSGPLVITYEGRLNNTVGYNILQVNNTAKVSWSSHVNAGRLRERQTVVGIGVASTPGFSMNISATSNPETQQALHVGGV